MIRDDGAVWVDSDNGGEWVTDWVDLVAAMLAALAYAIRVKADGMCACGCIKRDCLYCVGERCFA